MSVCDLGYQIEGKLGRFERDARFIYGAGAPTSLFWALNAEEGLSLRCALALGRMGAVLRPRRVTLLWFAGRNGPVGRLPSVNHRERALALAKVAVPAAMVQLCCLGWLADARNDMNDLARRFA
jgi:hypothetical protein